MFNGADMGLAGLIGFVTGVVIMMGAVLIIGPDDTICQIPHVDEPCVESIGLLPGQHGTDGEPVTCPVGTELETGGSYYWCECP